MQLSSVMRIGGLVFYLSAFPILQFYNFGPEMCHS